MIVLLCVALLGDGVEPLQWPLLKKARRAYVDGALKELPKEIKDLEGKWVSIGGYLQVKHGEGVVREVVLAELQYTGGIGVPPTPFDSIRLTFRPETNTQDLFKRPALVCSGYFRVIPEFRDEKLVRLFAMTHVVEGVVPEPKSSVESGAGLSFQTLERLRATGDYSQLDGKTVTLTGNVLIPYAQEEIKQVILAKNPWDGCCLGVPPTPYDSVMISFRDGAHLSDRYAKFATITGTFHAKRIEAKGYLISLFQIDDAVEGMPAPEKHFPVTLAAGGATVFLAVLWWLTRRKRA